MADKIRFGVYELDREARELRKHGVVLRLQEQPFRVLAMLAGRPGEIVTREELQEQIWGNTFVDFDQSLNKAIAGNEAVPITSGPYSEDLPVQPGGQHALHATRCLHPGQPSVIWVRDDSPQNRPYRYGRVLCVRRAAG